MNDRPLTSPLPNLTEAELHALLGGSNNILMGAPGSGKTYALPTYIEAGLSLVVVTTDPHGEESLLDSMSDRKLDFSKLYWRRAMPANPSWDTLKNQAQMISLSGYDDLTKIKTGIRKSDYGQFYGLLSTLANFVDERTGRELGPVDQLGPDFAFALDGLTGVNMMAMDMVIGAKPAAHQGEWGVAMNAEERLLMKLCSDCNCFFTLIAHVDKEYKENTGTTELMAGALGKKLAPKFPRTFSDIILSLKEGGNFSWSTIQAGADLKSRNLPFSAKLPPDFGQIVKVWRERKAKVEATLETQPSNQGAT